MNYFKIIWLLRFWVVLNLMGLGYLAKFHIKLGGGFGELRFDIESRCPQKRGGGPDIEVNVSKNRP